MPAANCLKASTPRMSSPPAGWWPCVVWGVDLFSSGEVSLCPDLLKLPTRHGLVLFRRHHTSCSFPTRSLGAVTAIVAKAARCRYFRIIRQCEVRRIFLPRTRVNKPPLDAPDASGWHHGCCRFVGENASWQEEKLVCPKRRT